MDLFWVDKSYKKEIAWSDLIQDLNSQKTYNPYCRHNDFYKIFRHLIISLIIKEEIIMLDFDFSDDEVQRLTGHSDLSQFEKVLKKDCVNLSSKSDLISNLLAVDNKWNITLFTSGTTGMPKKAKHSFHNITRFVKTNKKEEFTVWGFAYNPTHIAGIQVFLQAIMNGNPMIRLFGLAKNDVFNALNRYNVTHISATPTFFRLLLPASSKFNNIQRVTSGGEKLDAKTAEQLKALFPNAKMTNIYASTEAGTVFASSGDIFIIKPSISKYIKIENKELLIHYNLLGNGEFGNVEWYNTGDLVEIVSDDPLQFRIVARKNEMINVGGYKVNPVEVEESIRSIEGIKNARVYAKINSVIGYVICCEVVRSNIDLDEPHIRSILQSKLQEYKIPRMMKFVDELTITRTGKIKRE